jgi:hypothetical protein
MIILKMIACFIALELCILGISWIVNKLWSDEID